MKTDYDRFVGMALDDPRLPTPAFVIDAEKLDRNLREAKDKAKALGVALRPHLKTHKCIEIAREQMLSPEGPGTVSTLAEAEAFAVAGVKDLIYAVGIAPQKLSSVERIRASGCDLKILLDSVPAAEAVANYCRLNRTRLPALIEIDVDGHRSGIKPEAPELLDVAAALADGGEIAGVLTHAGGSYDCKSADEIRAAAKRERDGIVLAAKRLRDAGFDCPIVSLGSTPTLWFAEDETGVTEVRAGVYALFDLFMANLGVCSIERIAGAVLATVIGCQREKGQVIVDAGFLAMSRDRGTQRQARDYGFGLVCGIDGEPLQGGTVIMTGTNQEHGILMRAPWAEDQTPLDPDDIPYGRRVLILPNHACPTAAPYRTLLFTKAGLVCAEHPHVRGWEYRPKEFD